MLELETELLHIESDRAADVRNLVANTVERNVSLLHAPPPRKRRAPQPDVQGQTLVSGIGSARWPEKNMRASISPARRGGIERMLHRAAERSSVSVLEDGARP